MKMPPILRSAALGVLLATAAPASAAPDELAALEKKYSGALAERTRQFDDQLAALDAKYIGALGGLGPDAAAEVAHIRAGKGGELEGEPGGRLGELRATYLAARGEIESERAAAVEELDGTFIGLLEDLKAETTGEDRAAVESRIKALGGGADEAAKPGGAADFVPPGAAEDWPTSVAVDDDFEVEEVKADAEAGEYIYRTPHFEFHVDARLSITLVRDFSRIFEATFTAINALPLGLDCQPPQDGYFLTELFVDEADYYAAGGPPGSAGVFTWRGDSGKIMIPLENLGVKVVGKGFSIDYDAENTTLIHEISHQVMIEWLQVLPVWFTEGMADYMAAAPYRKGRFTFTAPMRAMRDYLKATRGVWDKGYQMKSLAELMSISSSEWLSALGGGSIRNYASADMAVMFFMHEDGDGKTAGVRNYLAAVRSGMAEPEASEKFLVRGRTFPEIQDAMAKAWRGEGIKLEFDDAPEAEN